MATGSDTTVSPSAWRPASRMADLTWALATGGVYSMPVQGAAGDGEGWEAPLPAVR